MSRSKVIVALVASSFAFAAPAFAADAASFSNTGSLSAGKELVSKGSFASAAAVAKSVTTGSGSSNSFSLKGNDLFAGSITSTSGTSVTSSFSAKFSGSDKNLLTEGLKGRSATMSAK